MDTSDDQDTLMRKLAIYEFGCTNILIFNLVLYLDI